MSQQCHDCGVKEGQIHKFGCDMERCPCCGKQLISCDCFEDITLIPLSGRVPYIAYPDMCGRCGELWPDMFMVPDEEWEKYIQINQRGKVLCKPCYNTIKKLIDVTTPKQTNAIAKAKEG